MRGYQSARKVILKQKIDREKKREGEIDTVKGRDLEVLKGDEILHISLSNISLFFSFLLP